MNTLGWRSLRPLQEKSIPPVLAGHHCVLLAPTAGGKTEAASFPVLSRICSERRSGLSVLYICPLKALLNNLHERLSGYAQMVGRSCDLWHGDISQGRRAKIKASPPDILLTTPESLEVMLIGQRDDGRNMLKDVDTVIIDEIHAFAGDDRGWHLLSILERLGKLGGREIQRIGLSATVGNPAELLDWLAGHCEGERVVIQPEAAAPTDQTEVQLDYVGSLENAAVVISRLYRGEKRLVFCDSRSRVEELGNELRRLGVSVFLSHSSLSAEERSSSERAFAEARDCIIVSTSTLELGIDVGDLDRVIQIDAPPTVASFLQRLGRTGRRSGALRNCLFLATSDQALLRAAALINLWEEGFVEPIVPPARPLHLLAQQVMALGLQEKGIGIHDWENWVSRLPPFFREGESNREEIIQHLLQEQILFSDGVRMSFGDKGLELYGRRHFLELISIFTSDPVFTVFNGRKELGTVDQVTFARGDRDHPTTLSLGGKNWTVTSLDWNRRQAFVIPTEVKGKSQWMGGKVGLPYKLSRAIHALLVSDEISERWSERAVNGIDMLRADYDFLWPDHDLVTVDDTLEEVCWYTFSGLITNTAIADTIRAIGIKDVTTTDFSIRIEGLRKPELLFGKLEAISPEQIRDSFRVSDAFLSKLKFYEALPKAMAKEIMRERIISVENIAATMGRKRQIFSVRS